MLRRSESPTTFLYDLSGNPIATIDALGYRTTQVYDSMNRVEAVVDALNNRTTYQYNATGMVEATIDARGNRTTDVYDNENRLAVVVDALGNRPAASERAAAGTTNVDNDSGWQRSMRWEFGTQPSTIVSC